MSERIGPLFKWFGSKWQSSKHYPQPEHEIIVEPFAGGAGYSLNHCEKRVIIWEDDPNLHALWQWLIDSATGCRCDCGEIATVTTGNLRSGNSTACMFWRNHGGDRAARTVQTRRSRKVA